MIGDDRLVHGEFTHVGPCETIVRALAGEPYGPWSRSRRIRAWIAKRVLGEALQVCAACGKLRIVDE
jgi:hypothetical protein